MIKRLAVILIIILVAIPIAVWYFAPVFADFQLKKYLEKADTASYSQLELDLWEGNLILHDLYLQDTSGNISQQPVLVGLDYIAIKGLNLWKVYFEERVTIDSLMLGKGKVIAPLYKQNNNPNTAHDSLGKQLSIPFNSLTLSHLAIDSIDIVLSLNPNEKNEKYSGILMLKADSINVHFVKGESLSYQKADLKLRSIYAQPINSIAYYTADSLNLISANRTLALHGFKLRQRIKERYYARHFGVDKVYAEVAANHILVKGLPKRLRNFADGIYLSHIKVTDPQAYLYKNSRYPHSKNEKIFIVEAIQDLDFPIRVDTVDLVGGQLTFSQNWRKDYVPGILILAVDNARMLNYTNLEPDTERGKWTTITGNLFMYEKLQLQVDWKFDLTKKGAVFVLDIAIGSSPFARLNPYTENTVGVRFKDGILDGGRLLVEADKKSGAGTLELYYHDMKVEFLDREDHHKNAIYWAEGSLANLVVRNNNIADNKPRLGVVYMERVANKAIFDYVSKMFFSGFKDLAIASNNTDKVTERGMVYLPMPQKVQEKIEKGALKEEKQSKRAQRRADRRSKRTTENR